MTDDNKIKSTFAIDKELYEQCKKLAAKDGRSFNGLIVKLLNDYIRLQGGK